MARPVIGGHFAFLTLGKACGGKAMEGLAFLEDGDEREGAAAGSWDREVVLGLGAGEL